MRPLAQRAATLLLVLAALAGPGAAAAQAPANGPEELWKAYPLDPATTVPYHSQAPGVPPPSVARPLSERDDEPPTMAIVVGAAGLILLGGVVVALAVSRSRERRAWRNARRAVRDE
jgi:hypothetical protein